MKTKSIICALLLASGVGISTTSCEDMLSADSDRTINNNATDSLYGYWGIMKAVQNIAERYVILGEARADLMAPTNVVSDTINNIANYKMLRDGACRYLEVKDYYTVINGCNNYLADIDANRLNSAGERIFEKEMAQVAAVRAWTYIQLVTHYGEVPYYTEPIKDLGFVDDFDFSKPENKLNRDNLISVLAPTLIEYEKVPLPNYGSYDNGSQDQIASTLTMFPIRLVLGDIYLTGAKTKADYERAAGFYHTYLKENGGFLPISLNTTPVEVGFEEFMYTGTSWLEVFKSTSSPVGKGYTGEAITVIPSAAGILHGQVLTGVADVLGWAPETSMGGGSSTESSAGVSIKPDLSSRQLAASDQYISLCDSQEYVVLPVGEKAQVEVKKGAGDARRAAISYYTFQTGQEKQGFILKPAVANFSYTFPVIYRKALVWLRYAEAINRAGFPSYAFAVLKNGLCKEYLPDYRKTTVEVENPEDPDNPIMKDTVIFDYDTKVCKYIAKKEFDRIYKDSANHQYILFTSEFTSGSVSDPNVVGVHVRGCGTAHKADSSFYTYDRMLEKQFKLMNIADAQLTENDTINAVENLIVDELALETAWEGNRFQDLVRIASHKTQAGLDGVTWFADKIARRNDKRDPNNVIRDENLFNLLKSEKNWYLPLPNYK